MQWLQRQYGSLQLFFEVVRKAEETKEVVDESGYSRRRLCVLVAA